MVKRATVAFLAAVYLLPGALFAQTADICSITRSLSRGMNGADVTILQDFLKTEGSFTTTATGYFGPVTEAVLANWQLKVGVIASIMDGGVYGPKTKQYIAKKYCGGTTQAAATNVCTAAPTQPLLSCTGTWQKTYGANTCHVGWTCVPTQAATAADKSPTIFSIAGPSKLKPGESGTWNVIASDPEGTQLTFTIIWGDEGGTTAQLLELAGLGTNATTNTSFSHAYPAAGYFTIVVTARDQAGNAGKATFGVVIESPVPAYSQSNYYSQASYTSYSQGSYGQTSTASCVTPWGGKTVAHNEVVSSQPYFTNGTFTGTVVVPQMRCSNGAWLRCDWKGNNCQAPPNQCTFDSSPVGEGRIAECWCKSCAQIAPVVYTCSGGLWTMSLVSVGQTNLQSDTQFGTCSLRP